MEKEKHCVEPRLTSHKESDTNNKKGIIETKKEKVIQWIISSRNSHPIKLSQGVVGEADATH